MVALANFQKEFLKSCSTRQSMLCYWHCVSLPSLLGTYIVLLRTHTGKFFRFQIEIQRKVALARKCKRVNDWVYKCPRETKFGFKFLKIPLRRWNFLQVLSFLHFQSAAFISIGDYSKAPVPKKRRNFLHIHKSSTSWSSLFKQEVMPDKNVLFLGSELVARQ